MLRELSNYEIGLLTEILKDSRDADQIALDEIAQGLESSLNWDHLKARITVVGLVLGAISQQLLQQIA